MPKKYSLGELVDAAFRLRSELAEANETVKEIKQKQALVNEAIIDRLQEQGLRKAEGSAGTASLSFTTNPRIEDWDKLVRFINRHDKELTLLQRRLSAVRYRELLEERGEKKGVPGLEPIVVTNLNLRKS